MCLRVLGAVLAGGRSRRFGSDKALALFEGRKLLDHVIEGLVRQSDSLVVCGRDVAGQHCLPDRPGPDLGPLGGLAAALHHAHTRGFDGILTSACDTPLIPADLRARLAGPEPAVVVGQPLLGYWPAQLSAELDDFLSHSTSRAMGEWAVWAGARRVRCNTRIPNINTLSDLAALRARGLVGA